MSSWIKIMYISCPFKITRHKCLNHWQQKCLHPEVKMSKLDIKCQNLVWPPWIFLNGSNRLFIEGTDKEEIGPKAAVFHGLLMSTLMYIVGINYMAAADPFVCLVSSVMLSLGRARDHNHKCVQCCEKPLWTVLKLILIKNSWCYVFTVSAWQ